MSVVRRPSADRHADDGTPIALISLQWIMLDLMTMFVLAHISLASLEINVMSLSILSTVRNVLTIAFSVAGDTLRNAYAEYDL